MVLDKEEQTYYTRKVYKGDRPTEVIDEGLTRKGAMDLVAEDIESNPDCDEYMLVFDKE